MKNKKILIAVIALLAVAGFMLGIYSATREKPEDASKNPTEQNQASGQETTAPVNNGEDTTQENTKPIGSKRITVTVVHKDGSSKDFVYDTNEDYLGPVLLDEGLVEGSQDAYGLYIKVVDGESAVYEKDGAYWALYEGDETAMTGADSIVIHDGDVFKLVYTGA